MWLLFAGLGLLCAVFYGLSIAYTKGRYGVDPMAFVAFWMSGTIFGLSVLLSAAYSKGMFDFNSFRATPQLIILLPLAGIIVGTLLNVSIPLALAGAPNPGYVFAIAACAAPLIGALSVHLGVAEGHTLTPLNWAGLVLLPIAVLLATFKT